MAVFETNSADDIVEVLIHQAVDMAEQMEVSISIETGGEPVSTRLTLAQAHSLGMYLYLLKREAACES